MPFRGGGVTSSFSPLVAPLVASWLNSKTGVLVNNVDNDIDFWSGDNVRLFSALLSSDRDSGFSTDLWALPGGRIPGGASSSRDEDTCFCKVEHPDFCKTSWSILALVALEGVESNPETAFDILEFDQKSNAYDRISLHCRRIRLGTYTLGFVQHQH